MSYCFRKCNKVTCHSLTLTDSDDDDDDVSDLPPDELVCNNRIVQTVPAKEPQMDALPLKSALKKSAAAAKQVTESKIHESR